MKTLYTDNFAGASQATKDFMAMGDLRRGDIRQILQVQFGVVRVRNLQPSQFSKYITMLGMEVFNG